MFHQLFHYLREGNDKVVNIGKLSGILNLTLGDLVQTVSNIVANAQIEQRRLLTHQSDMSTKVPNIDAFYIIAIHQLNLIKLY